MDSEPGASGMDVKTWMDATADLDDLAEKGVASVQCVLGARLIKGLHKHVDPEKGFHWLQKVLARDVAEAMYCLVDCYLDRIGVAEAPTGPVAFSRMELPHACPAYRSIQDAHSSTNTLDRRIPRERRDASGRLSSRMSSGLFLSWKSVSRGTGAPKGPDDAVRLFERDTELGHPASQDQLGFRRCFCHGTERDHEELVRWHGLTMEGDCPEAAAHPGARHEESQGVPKTWRSRLPVPAGCGCRRCRGTGVARPQRTRVGRGLQPVLMSHPVFPVFFQRQRLGL